MQDKNIAVQPAGSQSESGSNDSTVSTEVSKNPNPRANENLENPAHQGKEDETGVGSEITDGEDG